MTTEMKTRAEPTPGPWRVVSPPWKPLDGGQSEALRIEGVTESGGHDRSKTMKRRVALVTWDPGTHRDEARANARLIRAVPELLKAALMVAAEAEPRKTARGAPQWAVSDENMKALESAIAKARGEGEPQVTVRGSE